MMDTCVYIYIYIYIYTRGHTDINTDERGEVHTELLDERWVE
jgi:hypothetical protein